MKDTCKFPKSITSTTLNDEDENCDLISSLYEKVMDPDPQVHLKAAHVFMTYDILCAFLLPNEKAIELINKDDLSALGIVRACLHYSKNRFFLEDNQILNEINKISSIPTIIVQGRYDLICPMKGAYDLHKFMLNSQLWIVPDAGHSSSEPGIALALKMAMDQIIKIRGLAAIACE
jgi:proline iminopeptidase